MGLLGYPLLDLNIFEYFLNSRFCRKKQLLLLDLIWVWGMFRVKRQEWKWIPVNGSDSKWKERKENEDPTKKSLPKVKLYSTSLMHKWEDKWILFAMRRGGIPKSMLGYWSTIEPSGHRPIPEKAYVLNRQATKQPSKQSCQGKRRAEPI